MSDSPPQAIFDCNVFVQALMNPAGPAGACVQLALDRHIQLFFTRYILDELQQMPDRPTPAKLGVSAAKVERLTANLLITATWIDDVPHVFDHPVDPDDSHYLDLAVFTQTKLIVSRDRHLLGMNDFAKPWSSDFRKRFFDLRVASPEELLTMLQREPHK
ncbi:MAG TPA: putative toxin-antitoxin system toxin component, PIN family [Tepidisphaeraceae bacterium]